MEKAIFIYVIPVLSMSSYTESANATRNECFGLQCTNGGRVEFNDEFCRCTCPTGFSGIFCELSLEEGYWPPGPYALPMSKYGCPEPENRGWKRGYINITTVKPMDITWSRGSEVYYHGSSSLLESNASLIDQYLYTNPEITVKGPFSEFVYQMNFCFKSDQSINNMTGSWPKGAYGIYAADGGCPTGFIRHRQMLTFPEILRWNSDGYLPEFNINQTGTLELFVCLTNHMNATDEFQRMEPPFSLLKHTLFECPTYDDISTQQETLAIIHEDELKDNMGIGNSTTNAFIYCHYIPSNWLPSTVTLLNEDPSLDDPAKVGFMLFGTNIEMKEQVKRLRNNIIPSTLYHTLNYPFYDGDMRTPLSLLQKLDKVPWMIIDLHRTNNVKGIFGVLQYTISGTSFLKEFPAIHVSDDKWSFLYDGAYLCRYQTLFSVEPIYFHRLYKPVRGRYVSLTVDNFRTSVDAAKYILALFIVEVAVTPNQKDNRNVTKRCHMDLGMRDGAIDSFQLTASSWNEPYRPEQAMPTGAGWCASQHDTDPFIQIDLLSVTLVEGVSIFNWYLIASDKNDNLFLRRIKPMGARAFRVEYGFQEHLLKNYSTKKFEIDLSMDYSTPQTFTFLKPFLARLIRIYPDALTSLSCLRLDLLGCRKSRTRQLQCTGDHETQVANVSQPYVSVYGGKMLSSVKDWDACADLCLSDKQECGTIVYNPNTKECEIFRPSASHNYQRYSKSDPGSIVSQKLCFNDPIAVKQMVFLHNVKDIHVHSDIGENDVITSYGFPFYYDVNQQVMWKVKVEKHKFVSLIFTNISLNVYQDDEPTCTDQLYVGQALTFQRVADRGNDKNNKLYTNKDNDDQPIIVTEHSELDVVFFTCTDMPKTFKGNGFRAIVKATDIPFCRDSLFGASGICSRDPMSIASPSYFRLSRQNEYITLTIEAPLFHTIVLTMTDFSVECYSGTLFSIERLENQKKFYCNMERPPAKMRSLVNALQITFSTINSRMVKWEGFRAVYHFEKIDNMLSQLSFDKSDNRYEVCSQELNKCFVFGTLDSTTTLGFEQSKNECSARKIGLVTLHSEMEMTVVRQLLYHFIYNQSDIIYQNDCYRSPCLRSNFDEAKFIVFIGLNLVTDRYGERGELWEDGSPVTFTAWALGEPSERYRKQCTYMDFQILEDTRTWRTSICAETPGTRVFICEKRIEKSPKQGNLLSTWIRTKPQSIKKESIFQCGSGEWISILSRCDGLPECRDRSDERNCPPDWNMYTWSYFSCDNGQLISMSRVCNHVSDCLHGEDEFCNFPECKPDEFECANRQCVPDYARCDATIDCIDRSDELNCDQCNSSTAFLCGDGTCIPSHFVCDNNPDCPDAEDENVCKDRNMNSCIQWWEAGYRETGMYKIGSIDAECNFDSIWTEGIVRTIVHNRTIGLNAPNRNRLSEQEMGLLDLTETNVCEQRIYRTCDPARQAIAQLDGIYPGKSYSECACTERTATFTKPFRDSKKACNGDKDMLTKVKIIFDRRVPVWFATSTSEEDGVRYTLEPMICETVFLPQLDDQFLCAGSHTTIPASRRCLYDEDLTGRPLGCRSKEHLQNCEEFVCPSDYVKCPGGFCIATHLVCDGRSHCRGGEDEIDCWCNESKHDVLIFTFGKISMSSSQYITRLSEQFLSNTNTVKVARVFDSESSFEVNLLVPAQYDSPILKVYETTLSWEKRTTGEVLNTRIYSSTEKDVMFRVAESLVCNDTKCGIIFISDTKSTDDIKRFMYEKDSIKKNAIIYHITPHQTMNKTAVVESVQDVTRVKVLNMKLLARVGSSLFPELCTGLNNTSLDGGYLCLETRRIIAAEHLCDGTIHCPLGDDETLCNTDCPDKCACAGFMADCRNVSFSDTDWDSISTSLRTLDLSKNKKITEIRSETSKPFLVKLNMSFCSVHNLSDEYLNGNNFPNLKVLDLSHNKIAVVRTRTFSSLYALKILRLEGNKDLKDIEPNAFTGLTRLMQFSISGARTSKLRANSFSGLDIDELDLSSNHITNIEGLAFNGLKAKVINLLSNDIKSFNKDMFTGTSSVRNLLMPAYKFCCVRPSYVSEANCSPPKDEFSSCEDLMRNPILQTLLWLIGMCALLGNIMSLAYRVLYDRERLKIGYGIFVTNLAVADLFMGCYMTIIAIADVSFRKRYLWLDEYWRNSGWCTFAGALSTASSEASVLFICFITLDRLLVVKYPFGKIRFHAFSAWIICGIVWLFTSTAAITPIVYTDYFKDKFYAKSAVCLALPITRDRSPGWLYSVVIFIGVNFATFVVIACGQWMIYKEVANASVARIRTEGRRKDLHVARNLLLVASTDFLCWFPIGCMGIIALTGHPISGDAYAWAAVLILPINSALNPFLYTLSAIVGKKKFTPDVDELSRSELSKDQLVQLWNNETFARKSEQINGKSIHDFIAEKRLSVANAFAIAVKLLQSVEMLHDCHLVHGHLTTHNVMISPFTSRKKSGRIRIVLEPQIRRHSQSDRAVDINDIGCIVRSLVQNTNGACETRTGAPETAK